MKVLLIITFFILTAAGLVMVKFANQPPSAPLAQNANTAAAPTPQSNEDPQLSNRLKKLSDKSGGKVSVAVLHIETGKLSVVDASNELPLFSVFKLPLAIAVLKNVEEGRLKLEQKVHIGPEDVMPGIRSNTQRWQKPADLTIQQLLELSIIESDNTPTEKLLQLVGGPSAVTERMRSLDLHQIDIRTSIKEYFAKRPSGAESVRPNTGSAIGLVKLLSRLQGGELLQPAQTQLVIGMMERATTGMRRLRGNLPPGTKVADKTGSGDVNPKTNYAISTNDVGLTTLSNGRGHLAMAVLLHDSTLPDAQQEKLIADLARAAFDAYSLPR